MITNADITVYNRKANPERKRFEFVRHYIPAVSWHTNQKVSNGEKGLQSADEYQIRIPVEGLDGYLPPEEYAALEYGEHSGFWTVENGDLFVKGEITDEIEKISDIAGKHLVYGTVRSYSDNRRGVTPHVRFSGGV